jgi:hypothetical protein
MEDLQQLDATLDQLRPSLEADGFSLHVTAREGNTVRVVLEATPDACADCLVPEDVIRRIVADAVSRYDPSISGVDLERRGFDAAPGSASPGTHDQSARPRGDEGLVGHISQPR